MAEATLEAIAIDPEALVVAYERARRVNESGDHAWRITPGQRIDLYRLIADLRGPGGIAQSGVSPEVWVNYLAPILAESGQARRLLRDVLVDFRPDAPQPEVSQPQRVQTLKPRRPGRLARIYAKSAPIWWLLFSASLLAFIVGSGIWFWSKQPSTTITSEQIGSKGISPVPQPPRGRGNLDPQSQADQAYDRAMAVTLELLKDPAAMSGGLTPRLLAAAHVGSSPQLGTPETLLVEILRGWPLPPDILLTADARGIMSLKHLNAEIAAIETSLPLVLFEGRIALPDKLLDPSLLKPSGIGAASGTAQVTPWSRAWLSIAALPFFLFLFYAAFRFRQWIDALLERWMSAEEHALGGPPILEGIRQVSGAVSGRPPKAVVTREGLRSLTRYRPQAGRRLDGRRSVRAVLRNAGYADPVMQRVQRMVDYLVIIQRWQPHDHERLRVRSFLETMAERGLAISCYDYERNPLFVRRTRAASGAARMEGLNGREELVSLPTLRDLHPNARLILVTDGRDIVDRVTGRVREQVVRGLRFWSERMVLSPVPVGDWGEVEFALSRDLDAPLGRTTQDMVTDLARGFRPVSGQAHHRLAIERTRGVPGLERLDIWWKAATEGYESAANVAGGPNLSPDETLLVTDLEPSASHVADVASDLRRWLGAKGFLWHAGCAIYPLLRFDLTLHIGMNLRVGPHPEAPAVFRDTPSDRRIFERLTALPWFRTGRMPEWLRREVLAKISSDELERAGEIIRALFDPAKSSDSGPLAIWWPRTGALLMPPDAVMASALAGNVRLPAPPVTPEREAAMRTAARRSVLKHDAGVAAVLAGASAGAAWLAPDFRTSPHPMGAWFPVLTFLSACAITGAVYFFVRRKQATRIEPPPRLSPKQVPTSTPVESAASLREEVESTTSTAPPTETDEPARGESSGANRERPLA
jgi:hypothetical protein